jgi:hypothetical protein
MRIAQEFLQPLDEDPPALHRLQPPALSLAGVEEDNVAVCTRKKSSLGES